MNKNFKVRAVFSDVDGTLLNSSHRVTPRTGEWIHRLTNMGIPFVIVSARSPSGIYPIMRRNDFRSALIAYSGALIMDADRNILFSREIERALALKIEQFFEKKKYDMSWCIYSGDDWLSRDRSDGFPGTGAIPALPEKRVSWRHSPEREVSRTSRTEQVSTNFSASARRAPFLRSKGK